LTVPTVDGTTSARDGLEVVIVRLARHAVVVEVKMEREKDMSEKGMAVGSWGWRFPFDFHLLPWTRVFRHGRSAAGSKVL
jgi:hypothetical protein